MKIKIISQNVRHCNDGPGHMVADRMPRIRELLKKYDADIVGFQEIRERWLNMLQENFGEDYEIHHRYRSEYGPEAATMMWKKSRFDCLDKGYFWLSPTPHIQSHSWDIGSGYNDYRICMWATLKDKETGHTFTYFNTHYSFGDERHRLSNQLIRDHIREAGIDAAVVTADFNFNNTSVGYRDMVRTMGDLNVDTVNDPRTTFTGYKHGRVGSPIDFIFYTKGTIKPLTYHLMDEMFDGYFASDHFGVYGEFEIREKLRLGTLDVHADGPESERLSLKARHKYTKSILEYTTDRDIIGWQGATEEFLAEWPAHYNRFTYAGTAPNPICYRSDRFEPVEVKGLDLDGEEGTLAVMEQKGTKEQVCIINGTLRSQKAAQEVLAAAEEYPEMPVFFVGGAGNLESVPYQTLSRKFTDIRIAIAPKNFSPTYQGYDGEVKIPAITEMIFTNGVAQKLLDYKVENAQYGKARVSDHNQVLATVLLNKEEE